MWVTLCDWRKFVEKISKIQKDNLLSQKQLLEEQHQPPKTWCSNAKSKFARKPTKRHVQQQTRQEWQIHVMPDHTILLVESEDQRSMKLKLSNFPRTVFQNDFLSQSKTRIQNSKKTISVPVVKPENCNSLVNGICVVQRDDSSLESSTSSQQMTVVSVALVLVTTMNL